MSILCGAFALTSVTAATAHQNHARPPAQSHSASPPPTTPAGGTAAEEVGAGQNPQPQGSRGEQPPRHPAPVAKHRRTRTPAASTTPAASATPAVKAQPGEQAVPAAGSETGESEVPGGSVRHERIHHDKPKESKRGLHTPQPPPSSQPAPAAEAPAVAASVPATPATPIATSATPTPTPVVTRPPTPSRPGRPRTPARRGRAASPAARGRGAAGALVLGGLEHAPVVAAATRRTAGDRGESGGTPARAAHSGESPLVHTVTQTVTHIISVVPPLMRALIGALVALALALGASSQLAALRARRLARQRAQLLADVGLMQAALLPPLPVRLGPVGTTAAYRPASGPAAGGDFYDVFALGDGRLGLIVGDVSGHGRQALPHTTLVRYTLRAYLEAGLAPRAALQTAAPVLERQLGDSFATVALATYDPRERTLVYSCAGHPPPAVIGEESIAPITASSAPPIGVGETTGTRQTIVHIPGGALVCFYTDGVVEARIGGELFGAQRLERLLGELDQDDGADTLLDRVAAQSDKHPDDMAACLLRIEGEPGVPAVQVEELELDARHASGDRAERFLLAGGVHPAEAEQIAVSTRRVVAQHGRVVLELHHGDGEPQIALRPQNVAVLAPSLREVAGVQRVLG